ncbi:MAG: CoA transferase [Gemmatimonadaceae bacterium]|nr:CoA transferase [Gemmatimonadaceae bacterium]
MSLDLPLAGLRVVSLAVNVPGPVAAARLADMGAHVTKVEPPSGDFLQGGAPEWYRQLTARQRVITLDLRTDEGRNALADTLGDADILIVSNRPSALPRMGLHREALLARYPRLCVVSIIGHPSPDQERPGHDLTYLVEAGVLDGSALPRSLFSDLAAADQAVAAALALIIRRGRTGVGGWQEVSLADAAHALSAPLVHGLTRAGGVLGGGHPGYAFYRAADGVVAVAALEPHFLQRFVAALALAEPDPAAISFSVRQRTVRDLLALGAAHDFPIAAVTA